MLIESKRSPPYYDLQQQVITPEENGAVSIQNLQSPECQNFEVDMGHPICRIRWLHSQSLIKT
jgi:hypothetical protein